MSLLKHLESLICHPESRYPRAFQTDGRTFVTDGAVLFELFGEHEVKRPHAKPPDAIQLISRYEFTGATNDLPVVDGPPEDTNAFWERGSSNTTCGECDGSGEVTCDYGHDHDCPDCNGKGVVDGTIQCDEATAAVHVLGGTFCRRYLWVLSHCPNIRIGFIPGEDSVLVFAFDGGRGVLAGRKLA